MSEQNTMAYAFDDYEGFLQTVSNEEDTNFNGFKNNSAKLQGNSIVSNPSYTNSLSISTDEEENVLNSFYDFEVPAVQTGATNSISNTLLSPHDYSSNSSNSPNDVLQNLVFNNDSTFDFQQQQMSSIQQMDQYVMETKVKTESRSSSVSINSPTSNSQLQSQQRVKLANAVPRGSSISKRGPKKEKSSHNMIEKRYRTNINDKIKALRDSVPALRVLVDSGDYDEHDDELDGLQPAKKLNKATILSKATEYIKHLEAKNDALRDENSELKIKLYGNGTQNHLIAQQFSKQNGYNYQSTQNNSSNFANKFLIGGLMCMAGASLNDDLNNVDSRSLFSLPVFGLDQPGLTMLSKPLVILLKVSIIMGVLLNFVFPNLFQSKCEKSKIQYSQQDVRKLKTSSVLSTFSLRPGLSNNEFINSAIFRALLLKVRYFNSNTVIKSFVDLYVDHLWSYLKEIKLDPSQKDYDVLRSILLLPNDQTIHNPTYIRSFIETDPTDLVGAYNDEADFSAVSILYNMIHDTNSNQTLRKFLLTSLTETDKTVPEIQQQLNLEIDNQDIELKTFFNPNEEQIEKLTHKLNDDSETENIDGFLVLYFSTIQNLIFDKKDYSNVKEWFDKIDNQMIDDSQLLGFTSLYSIILILSSTKEMSDIIQKDKEFSFRMEEISGRLRIWSGSSNGSILNFKKRSQLIDYFVNINLKMNGLESNEGLQHVERPMILQ